MAISIAQILAKTKSILTAGRMDGPEATEDERRSKEKPLTLRASGLVRKELLQFREKK
jgi:hypothetical protein